MRIMSQQWGHFPKSQGRPAARRFPDRTLRDEFLRASREGHRLRLALTSSPDLHAYERWERERVRARRELDATQRGGPDVRRPRLGDSAGVERFLALATTGGRDPPVEFRPPSRLFPYRNELSNRDPSSSELWVEYLYVAQFTRFRVEEDWPL